MESSVNCPSQETEVTSTPTRLVDNVVITTKALQLESTVNFPSQETEVTSTPTRPVDNVVITTKGLQDRNNYLLGGRWKIKVN